MSDDIVTRLREAATSNAGEYQLTMAPELCLAIADEIERLRAERLQWFAVARQLRDALIGAEEKDAAFDEYLRIRGRLEDPREQAKG